MSARLFPILGLAAAATLWGCSTHVAADPARLSLEPVFPTASAWPALSERDPGTAPPGTIDWVVATPVEIKGVGAIPIELFRAPVFRVARETTVGPCIARELTAIDEPRRRGHETLIDVDAGLVGRPQREFNATLRSDRRRQFTICFGGADVTGVMSPDIVGSLSDPKEYDPLVVGLVRDRAFTLTLPEGGPPRGIILRLRSFADNPFEESVAEELLRRGWAVLSGNFATSLSSVGRFELVGGPPLPVVAARIAEGVDLVCAERAYAAEGALAWVAEHHPEVPIHPAAIVGFSAGALGVAPVAARMPGRFDAAVLVCGGADLLSVCERNPMARIGLSVTMNGAALPQPVLDELCADYLSASTLDPYATAPALTGTPVLMIHGRRDRDVPADTGDLLYERLGRPERWTYDGGHARVFLMLPRLKGDIARWIERAVVAPPAQARIDNSR